MGARVTRTYVPGRYGQVHVRLARPDIGGPRASARPLVCLHQTPSNGADWEALMQLMGRDRLVIAPDTPGYGMSDPPPAPASVVELAQALAETVSLLAQLEGFDLAQFDIIGHHTGSVLAAELGRSDPRVGRLIFCSLPAFGERSRAAILDSIEGMFAPVDGSLARAEQLRTFHETFGDTRLDGEQRQIAMAEGLRLGARMDWGYRAVFSYDLAGVLRGLDHDVLVLNSEDDLNAVTSDAARWLGNADYRELRGCGHGFLAFVNEAFAQDLRGFLDAI